MEKTENLISREPRLQSAWISYLGAVLGVLQSFEKENIDRVSVGGYTGYAFALPNISKGVTCPSGPTALAVWPDIVKATGNLGYNVREFVNHGGYPASGEVTDKDRIRSKILFDLVKSAIDNDKPVIIWGIGLPEYGIVKGYSGDSYIVSSIRGLSNQPEIPIRYDDLHSPGSLHAIFFDEESLEISEDVDKESIGRAFKFSRGIRVHKTYVAGPAAYDEWAKSLESEIEDDRPYHGNSYNGECNLEAKRIACNFTKRLSEKYLEKPQAKYLEEASQKYSKIVRHLEKFQNMFPFALEGENPREKRFEGAKILRTIKPLEMQAQTHLKEAYDAWA